MERLIALCLAGLAALGLLSGCVRSAGPADPLAHIAYPELLPEGYAESSLAAGITSCGALVAAESGLGDTPLESVMEADYVRAEVERFLAGETDTLWLCALYERDYGEYTIGGRRYDPLFHRFDRAADGSLTADSTGQLPEIGSAPEAPEPLAGLALNDYGYLVWDYAADGRLDESLKLINDHDLYPDADERHRMYQTYLRPLTAYNYLLRDWDRVEDAGPAHLLYEDLSRAVDGNDLSDGDTGNYVFALEDCVDFLSRYFDGVTADWVIRCVRERGSYDPVTGLCRYPGGRGGVGPGYRVTGWQRDGEELTLSYETFDWCGRRLRTGTLVLHLTEDGGFRYRSNTIVFEG